MEVPCLTTRPQNKGHPSTQNPNPPPLEVILSVPIRQGSPWPNTGSASENLFETRKDWPIPPTLVPTPVPTISTEAPPQKAVIPHVMVRPKQAAEGFHGDHNAPFAKNEEEHEEDWDGNMQREQPSMHPQNMQQPQPKGTQSPQPQNAQQPQPQNTQHPSHNSTPSH